MEHLYATVNIIDVEIETGIVVECTVMKCMQCDLKVESLGTSERSRTECGDLLRTACPNKANNHCCPNRVKVFQTPSPEFMNELQRQFPWWSPVLSALKLK